MGLGDFIKGQFIDVIEHVDETNQLLVFCFAASFISFTKNLPVLSSLGALPRLFNSPIKSDLYFINTTQFIGNRWGTKNPILMRDKDFGIVRITSFGTYSFRVIEPARFIREVFGARKMNMTNHRHR